MTSDASTQKPALLLIEGFGDNSSMFDRLRDTDLAERFQLRPLDLPGFGTAPLPGETTLEALAGVVAGAAAETGAEIIVAHSVASIIASLAAGRRDCPLTTIVSLEGNLTAEDAYFSGTAADYDSPQPFRAAFLDRLDGMARTAPEIARYRNEVAKADPRSLWELGCDARSFSACHHPGEVLIRSASPVYVYTPDNCPKATLDWLNQADLSKIVLKNATHWPSVDQPAQLARKLGQALDRLGQDTGTPGRPALQGPVSR